MNGLIPSLAAAFAASSTLALPDIVPVPVPRPQTKMIDKSVQPSAKDDPISAPATITSACHSKLEILKVTFKPLPPMSNAEGCSITDPVELADLPGDVSLTPAAVFECETAVVLATFIQGIVQTKSNAILGSTLKEVKHDSAYVCRNRNGTGKLSEHAFGRAVDIGSFTTASGITIQVTAMPDTTSKEARFLGEVRAAACGPFKTVLGPGSDADHALHFHLDMAPRKGGAYCR